MAMGTSLAAAKASTFAGNSAARLIRSDDHESVIMNGMTFPGSALGNGVPGEVSCHWFTAGPSTWSEADGQRLTSVVVKLTLNFVAPSPGKEPLLYEIAGARATADYDGAVKSIASTYGAPQSSGETGAGQQTQWQIDTLKIIVTRHDPSSGAMQIDFLDRALEKIALGVY